MVLVSVEQGIGAFGFRRIASIAREFDPKAGIYFITIGNLYSLGTHLFPSSRSQLTEAHLEAMAAALAEGDLICFSAMTATSPQVESLIALIRKKNPGAFILWGGAHCIIYPDEAIKHADAICTGEGETAFTSFYKAFAAGEDFRKTPGMWFQTPAGILKNPICPLDGGAALAAFPPMYAGLDCSLFDYATRAFRPFTRRDYTTYNGLSYRTIWSRGCPYACIYCANSAFIAIDPNFRRVRYLPVESLIREIEEAIVLYPFVSTIAFYDDNFISIPLEVLQEFAAQYQARIGLPFVVFGLHPNAITEEKLELLAKAGMNRGRMGIQSGNTRMLTFYNRHTPLENIKKSADRLALMARKYHMIPPAYDIISDNPLETTEDIVQTLRFLYSLERPYTLTIFSLRVFPKTQLWDYFENHPEVDIRAMVSSYLDTKKNMANILLYLLATVKPPLFVFNRMLKSVRGYREKQSTFPILHLVVKTAYLASRAFQHVIKLDFSTISGGFLYTLWRMGLLRRRARKKTIAPVVTAPR